MIRRVLAVSVSLLLIAAQPASAAEVSVLGGETLEFNAAPSETNLVSMSLSGARNNWKVTIADYGAPIEAGSGCELDGALAVCSYESRQPGEVQAGLADGADSFDGSGLDDPDPHQPVYPAEVDGGTGADEITIGTLYSCADGGEGDDTITMLGHPPKAEIFERCFTTAGPGGDEIIGSSVYDAIGGGPGADLVRGRGGNDILSGGSAESGVDSVLGGGGNDSFYNSGLGSETLMGGPGKDFLHAYSVGLHRGDTAFTGGSGRDTASYLCGRCEIRLDGLANDGRPGIDDGDNVDAEAVWIQSAETTDGSYGPGHDVLEGGAAAEFLGSKRGDDLVIGGEGRDVIDAGLDDDRVHAEDGERDVVECGEGEDVARTDRFDIVHGCERVR